MTSALIKQAKQDANTLAFLIFEKATKAVDTAAAENGYPVPADVFEAFEKAAAALHVSAVALALDSELGTVVHTPDGPLTVVGSSYPNGTDTDEVVAGKVIATAAILTQDGHYAGLQTWHDGPSVGGVFVARYEPKGRTFHGYVDKASRKLVQTG